MGVLLNEVIRRQVAKIPMARIVTSLLVDCNAHRHKTYYCVRNFVTVINIILSSWLMNYENARFICCV